MRIKIVIAMHKPYRVPQDELYLPLFVGAAGKEDIFPEAAPVAGEQLGQGGAPEAAQSALAPLQRDDSGDNISAKNPYYCELTALYWAWKNLDAEAIGLAHYRRHFAGKGSSAKGKWSRILTGDSAQQLMAEADIIVPAKRRYYIESLYSHYSHTLDGTHLDLTRDIIAELHPEYIPALEQAYSSTSGHMFNMCIMRRPWLDAYCSWLFPILEELEHRLEGIGLATAPADAQPATAERPAADAQPTPFDARLYGRVSEILFNVWLCHQVGLPQPPRVKELPTIHMESVNWLKKGSAFLAAKFFKKKYTKSF